jgi:DNA-3-methyladenine glycosylase
MTDREFFRRDVLETAPALVGCYLVRTAPDGSEKRFMITETEAYAGESDTACHAHRGRTKRSEMLYHDGGTIFVYLCYGMHWMLNIVTGPAGSPQGALIRACRGVNGPGRVTKALGIDGSFNGGDILACSELRIEAGDKIDITFGKRIGINYASQEDQDRLWRFTAQER